MRNYNSHMISNSSLHICGGMIVYRGWFSGYRDIDEW